MGETYGPDEDGIERGCFVPHQCPRLLETCQPLAYNCSTEDALHGGPKSFFCCGLNDGSDREVEQDRFTVCFKNEAIDERGHWDRRDIISQVSILSQALCIDENMAMDPCDACAPGAGSNSAASPATQEPSND